MKKVIMALALVMLLSLSVLASAENDSVTTGSYKISFDIGLKHIDHTVIVDPPKETESLDGTKYTDFVINITNKTKKGLFPQSIIILLTRFDKEIKPITADQIILGLTSHGEKYSETAKRQIDGVEGTILVGDLTFMEGPITIDNSKMYQVYYYPASDPNHLVCKISSLFPWDKGTLQLLKTIHIEKVK